MVTDASLPGIAVHCDYNSRANLIKWCVPAKFFLGRFQNRRSFSLAGIRPLARVSLLRTMATAAIWTGVRQVTDFPVQGRVTPSHCNEKNANPGFRGGGIRKVCLFA